MKACLLENCLAVNLAVPAKYDCLFSSSHNSVTVWTQAGNIKTKMG
jgi:hypothetical protein